MNKQRQCPKCGGTGRIDRFNRVRGGVCFRCEGRGFLVPGARKQAEDAAELERAAILKADHERRAAKARATIADDAPALLGLSGAEREARRIELAERIWTDGPNP